MDRLKHEAHVNRGRESSNYLSSKSKMAFCENVHTVSRYFRLWGFKRLQEFPVRWDWRKVLLYSSWPILHNLV